MADRTHPLSFRDLPRELRDMIYECLLPEDRTITFSESAQRPEETTVTTICRALPNSKEMQEAVYRHCGAHIAVTPDRNLNLPKNISWWRFQKIRIEIKHYYYGTSQPSLIGVDELVSALRAVKPRSLPDVMIQFCENRKAVAAYGRDLQWTMPVRRKTTIRWERGLEATTNHFSKDYYYWTRGPNYAQFGPEDVWLRTPHGMPETPIVIDILTKFTALPRCKSAVIMPLRGLQGRRWGVPPYDPEQRIFDRQYMYDMCTALKYWLEGREFVIRSGSDMINKDYFGISNLECLAYIRQGERYYCHGGIVVEEGPEDE